MVRRIEADGERHDVMFTLTDITALEAALKLHPDCKLVVVDPIGSFPSGRTDAHRDNEVRSVPAPVAKLAEKYGPAVLVVAPRRKSGGNIADDLALGSRVMARMANSRPWGLVSRRDSAKLGMFPDNYIKGRHDVKAGTPTAILSGSVSSRGRRPGRFSMPALMHNGD